MSLTKQDLQNIESIVDKTVVRRTKDLPTRQEIEDLVGRTESRITMAMGLLQRDTTSRIDGLEQRVSRLEKQTNS